MQPRFDIMAADPAVYRAMSALEQYLHQVSIEQPLIHLVKLYASEINHCAYCIDMHWKDLRALGETEQRCTDYQRGESRRTIPTASAPPSSGPKQLPSSQTDSYPMKRTKACGRTSQTRS